MSYMPQSLPEVACIYEKYDRGDIWNHYYETQDKRTLLVRVSESGQYDETSPFACDDMLTEDIESFSGYAVDVEEGKWDRPLYWGIMYMREDYVEKYMGLNLHCSVKKRLQNIGESWQDSYCPEVTFYQIEEDEGKKYAHISGDLLYNGDGQLELIEYTFGYIPIEELNEDDLYDRLSQFKQYYRKITDEEGKGLIDTYFNGDPSLIQDGDLFAVTEETPCGCYRHFWETCLEG